MLLYKLLSNQITATEYDMALALQQEYIALESWELAEKLRNGLDDNKDLKEARRQYALATNTPDTSVKCRAKHQLANMLRNGEGGDKDLKEARRLYHEILEEKEVVLTKGFTDDSAEKMMEEKAMKSMRYTQGCTQYYLACMLEKGEGGHKDRKKARDLFESASKLLETEEENEEDEEEDDSEEDDNEEDDSEDDGDSEEEEEEEDIPVTYYY